MRAGLACAALAGAALTGPSAWAAGRDWSGSERCGSCHPAQLAAWRATAHARPFASSLARANRTTLCLGCHTTGESPAGPIIENAVGCEACHGAGADYSAEDIMRNRRLAFDLGLVDFSAAPSVRAAVCAGCHRAVTTRPGAAGLDLSRLAHPPLPSLPSLPSLPQGSAGEARP